MPIRMDFTDVGSGNFEPFPVGEAVPATIYNITQKTGKDSGNPYLEFEFKVSGGNRKAWRNYSLQPNALWALKTTLVDLGYDKESLEAEFDLEPKELLGMDVELYFGPEREYNGRKTQDVDKVLAG